MKLKQAATEETAANSKQPEIKSQLLPWLWPGGCPQLDHGLPEGRPQKQAPTAAARSKHPAAAKIRLHRIHSSAIKMLHPQFSKQGVSQLTVAHQESSSSGQRKQQQQQQQRRQAIQTACLRPVRTYCAIPTQPSHTLGSATAVASVFIPPATVDLPSP